MSCSSALMLRKELGGLGYLQPGKRGKHLLNGRAFGSGSGRLACIEKVYCCIFYDVRVSIGISRAKGLVLNFVNFLFF